MINSRDLGIFFFSKADLEHACNRAPNFGVMPHLQCLNCRHAINPFPPPNVSHLSSNVADIRQKITQRRNRNHFFVGRRGGGREADEEGGEEEGRPGKESDAEGGLAAADDGQQPKATTTGRSPNGLLGLSLNDRFITV